MAQAMTESERAQKVAKKMESDEGEIEHRKSKQGRHVFGYTDVVHAHKLPEGWEFKGFGTGWFALGRV